MKPYRLHVEWINGVIDEFNNVKEYRVIDGTLHIWHFTDGHQGATVIPHHAYKMAWPEFMEK